MNLKDVIFVDICKIITNVYKNIFPETQTKFKYTYAQAENFASIIYVYLNSSFFLSILRVNK